MWKPKLLVVPLVFGLAIACVAQDRGSQPANRSESTRELHAAFDRILRDRVHGDRVDYLAIREHDWAALIAYLAHLAEVDPRSLEERDRLAFYINLYNATMIRAVVERLELGWTPAAQEWRVFDEKLVALRSGEVSLNHLEHEIIRKQFDEPRIHVALVCGARSCPPLLNRAYLGETLDADLEGRMRRFINDDSRNRLGRERARLSKIFEWYAADFGGSNGVRDYVQRYSDVDLSAAAIGFLEYSWELNIAKPSGRWVVVGDGERKGEIVEVLGAEDVGERVRVRLPFGRSTEWFAKSAVVPYAAW